MDGCLRDLGRRRLRARLEPLGDVRVAATLATTLLVMFGVFLVYTYISVVFDRATGGDGAHLAALISVWGIAATIGNLAAGHLTDRFGNRRIVNLAILIVGLDSR
jgi:DHA1 family inner membrane transport protein